RSHQSSLEDRTASPRTEATAPGSERETWCMAMSPPTMHDPRDERRLTLALFAVAWGANQFTPLLLVYRQRFGFGPAVLGALWGCYAVGLVPGLLLGGAASDARGRRPVVIPFFFLSLLATGVLIAGALWSPALALGRLLAGLVSGVVFGAGSAWLVELSAALHTRRAALAVTAGFCLGPLAAGLVADA